MRGRRRYRVPRRPRIPPFAAMAPVAQHRGRDAKLLRDLQQRPAAARQQPNRFSLELIGELTPSLAHSTPFRSPRSLAKVSTNSGKPQGEVRFNEKTVRARIRRVFAGASLTPFLRLAQVRSARSEFGMTCFSGIPTRAG